MPGTFIFLVILVGAVVVGLMVYGLLANRARLKAFAEWARARGLRHTQARDSGVDERYANLDCLQQGHNRYADNQCFGSLDGWDVHYFDYHYTTSSGSGKDRRETRHRFSVLVVTARFPLKELLVRPENLFDRVKGFFGFDDIDFESAEFSRRFHVGAHDRKWAYDVLHARSMQLLLEQPRYAIDMDRGWAAIYDQQIWGPPAVERAFSHLRGLLEAIPDYVVQQQSEAIL